MIDPKYANYLFALFYVAVYVMHHVDGDYAVQRRIRGGDTFRVAEGVVVRIRGRISGDQFGVAGCTEAGRGFG